jgi:CheY-like chemotaxis protein
MAMTANAYADDARKSKEAGMNAHLSKPVDTAKLFAAIRQVTQGA